MWSVVGVGMSCVNRLKREGESVEPCGTPSRMGLVFDEVSLYCTWASLPDRKFASHLLLLLCMLVLYILFVSMCLGVASKALLISIAISSVLLCGLLLLKPSVMSCVSLVSSVFVEYFVLNPCWDGASSMSGLIWFSISLSITLNGVLISVIGL